MYSPYGKFLLVPFLVLNGLHARAQWTGALTGTTNDGDHSYTRTANPPWSGGTPEDTWTGTLAGATTLYFGGNYATAGLWTLTPSGNFDLTLQGGGLVAPDGSAIAASDRTVTLGGNVYAENLTHGRTINLGSNTTNNQLALDLGGVQRTFTVATGDTLSLRSTMLNAGSGLIKAGAGTLRYEGSLQSNLGGTVRIDAGEIDFYNEFLASGGLGTATFQLNGGKFHLRSNAGDRTYNNDFIVTANSAFDYDSFASANSNPRRFIFGGVDIQGAYTLDFQNNNGGWYHFNGATTFGGAAVLNSNSAEGQSRPVFVGAVDDNGFGLTKTGSGLIDLANSANEITGALLVSQGQVLLRNAGAIGTPSSITLGSASTGFIGFLAADQTFSRSVTLGTANSGFSAGSVQAGTNFTMPATSVATLTGTISQGGLALALAGGLTGGVLRLDNGNRTAESGGTTVSGTVHASNMNNLSGGNLNITTGGAFVLDPTGASGPTWAQFVAARPNWGTGSGQVQLSGGMFAARNGDVAIDLDDITGVPANYFNSNFTLGSAAKQADGSYYVNGTVEIETDINLTATRTITLVHAGPGLTGNPLTQVAQGELSGDISGTGALSFAGNATGTGTVFRNAIGEVVLSGLNTWTGGINNQLNTGPGGLAIGNSETVFVRFDDTQRLSGTSIPTGDGSTPNQWISIKNNNTTYTETHGGAHGFLFTGDADGQAYDMPTYSRMVIGSTDGDNRGGSIGATSENVTGGSATLGRAVVALNHGSGTPGVTLGLLVRDGSFQLGDGSKQVVFVPTINPTAASDPLNRTALSDTTAARVLNKRGQGTLVLDNVAYNALGIDGQGTGVDKKSQFSWVIGTSVNGTFDGAVRETGTSSNDSLRDFAINLRGGVLESNNNLSNYGGVGFTRALGTAANQVNWSTGGGGFAAHGGAFTVNINATAANTEWTDTSFVGAGSSAAPLIFGSYTADNVVTFQNTIGLASGDNQTVTREIKVIDNPGTDDDYAVMSGNIHNRGTGTGGGSGTRSLNKTGDGRLVLTGANTYNGTTTISAGTLELGGGSNVSYAYTVNSGASFTHSGGTWVMGNNADNLFHVNGSGGTIQVADLADANDGTGVLRYTMDPGGVTTIELTDPNPFGQYANVNAWAAEWTIDLKSTFNLPEDFLPPVLNLMSSSAYDLTNLNNKLTMTAYDGLGAPLTYNNLVNGQSVFINTGVAVAEYSVSFTENGFDLTLEGSFAIPEPGTLSMIGLALLVLRRQFRKRCLAE